MIDRLRCLWLALTMPGDGLAETLEDLRDIKEFHSRPMADWPKVKVFAMELSRLPLVYTRPPFHVYEEGDE